jgi:hypothetical protein
LDEHCFAVAQSLPHSAWFTKTLEQKSAKDPYIDVSELYNQPSSGSVRVTDWSNATKRIRNPQVHVLEDLHLQYFVAFSWRFISCAPQNLASFACFGTGASFTKELLRAQSRNLLCNC